MDEASSGSHVDVVLVEVNHRTSTKVQKLLLTHEVLSRTDRSSPAADKR